MDFTFPNASIFVEETITDLAAPAIGGRWIDLWGGGVPEDDNPDHCHRIIFEAGERPFVDQLIYSFRGPFHGEEATLEKELQRQFMDELFRLKSQEQLRELGILEAFKRGIVHVEVCPGVAPPS